MFWTICILVGLSLATIFFMPLYNKWFYHPIIRSIETNNYPIENINFPAVTICSNNKVNFIKKHISRVVDFLFCLKWKTIRLWNLNWILFLNNPHGKICRKNTLVFRPTWKRPLEKALCSTSSLIFFWMNMKLMMLSNICWTTIQETYLE